jgi:NADPH:quinone reductase-like Zn-dependent oxidoreductase
MRRAKIRPGETVLINGAGGSIGAHGVQIAKSMGAEEVTAVDSTIKTLNPYGRYLMANPRISDMIRSVFTTRLTTKSAWFAFAGETKEELAALKKMIEQGKIVPIVHKVFPMEQAADAHSSVEAEQRLGAIVITIGD